MGFASTSPIYLSNDWIRSLVESDVHRRSVQPSGSDFLILNRAREPLSTAALRSRITRAGVDAGLSMVLTPHMLRHTAATQLIEAGVDIRFVQRLLGHASLTTTEIYTHVADRSLRRAITDADVLGRVLML